MKVTFEQSIEHSATEFYLLRERADDKNAFDEAVSWAINHRLVCDTKIGLVKSRQGVESQFSKYDWAEHYEEHPSLVFYDFFRGLLLNKYSRIVGGLNNSIQN